MAKTTQKKQKRKVAKEFEVHSSEFPKKKAPKLTMEDRVKMNLMKWQSLLLMAKMKEKNSKPSARSIPSLTIIFRLKIKTKSKLWLKKD